VEPTFLTLEELVLSVARGETAKSAVAEFFRANTAPA
jgi:hypothetical protein